MNIEKVLYFYHDLTKNMYKESTNDHHYRMVIHLPRAFKQIKVSKMKRLDLNVGYELIKYFKENTRNGNNSINKIIRYMKKVMLH